MKNNIVQVAIGVISKLDEVGNTQYFITKRHQDVHQGGKWEFPGGKMEEDETVAQALARELKEEVAIDILTCQPLIKIEHDYGDKKVSLSVFIVDNYSGVPCAQEGQGQAWFSLEELLTLDFPEANKTIVAELIKSNMAS